MESDDIVVAARSWMEKIDRSESYWMTFGEFDKPIWTHRYMNTYYKGGVPGLYFTGLVNSQEYDFVVLRRRHLDGRLGASETFVIEWL